MARSHQFSANIVSIVWEANDIKITPSRKSEGILSLARFSHVSDNIVSIVWEVNDMKITLSRKSEGILSLARFSRFSVIVTSIVWEVNDIKITPSGKFRLGSIQLFQCHRNVCFVGSQYHKDNNIKEINLGLARFNYFSITVVSVLWVVNIIKITTPRKPI